MPRRRLYKLSLAAFVVLTIVWIASGWVHVWYVTRTTGVGIVEGAVVGHNIGHFLAPPLGFRYAVLPWRMVMLPRFAWFPTYRRVTIPLWPAALLAGVSTFIFWRSSRPIPPGHCKTCRYDLTGNISGVCPECGTSTGDG